MSKMSDQSKFSGNKANNNEAPYKKAVLSPRMEALIPKSDSLLVKKAMISPFAGLR